MQEMNSKSGVALAVPPSQRQPRQGTVAMARFTSRGSSSFENETTRDSPVFDFFSGGNLSVRQDMKFLGWGGWEINNQTKILLFG